MKSERSGGTRPSDRDEPALATRSGSLVFHQAALGDFVLTWPLLRRLPRPVRVVAPWSHASLAAATLPEAGAVSIEQFEFTRMHAEGGPTSLSPAVRELFEHTAAVVSFVAGAGSAWADNAQRLLRHADRVLLDPRPPQGFRGHVTEWHTSAVKPGLPLQDAPAPTPPTPAPPDAPILLHPGSGGIAKCWPRERFAALASSLLAQGHDVRFVIGEAEVDRWDSAARATLETSGAVLDVLPSLEALAAAIRGCRLYAGNDAGPTHLAAQLGRPTLALFGPSDPVRFHPVGPAAQWLAPPSPRPMDWLSVDAVLHQVASMLKNPAEA